MKKKLPVMTCLTLALAAGQPSAQISTDATLGREPQELPGPHYAIGSDLGRIRGQNLFHSFERFSLATDESATFSGPDAIRNVISRVTGGEPSAIDGRIVSTVDGADFYFINPAGVLFGPNASLDVPGSFHVATADELRFRGGEVFSASNPAASSLSVAAPEAFGFLNRDAGRIILAGTEEFLVAPDRSLSLVGGDILIDASFVALRDFETRNGNVTLVAMSRPGTVAVADGSTSAAPQGEISVTDSEINLNSAAGGGVVRIRAGELQVENSFIIAHSEAEEPGAATALIDIESGRVHVDLAEIGSDALGAGNAGDVRMRAGELEISGGLISSSTFAAGNAGNVEVSADQLNIHSGEDFTTGITSSVELEQGVPPGLATGDAGTMTVEADEVTIRDRGIIGSNSADAGDAGRVEIAADRITVLAGGQIGSGTGLGSTGAGGNVVVNAREALTVRGQSRSVDPDTGDPFPSGIFASTESTSSNAGDAGTATVTAPSIMISDRGEISSETFNPAAGGTLLVSAEHLVIDNGEITTQAEAAGDGGDIRVAARVIELRNEGLISAESSGERAAAGAALGDAGDITIVEGERLVLNGGAITTSAQRSGGGGIAIEVDQLIDLQKSSITSSVAQDTGNAGDIVIDPDFLILDDSSILARVVAGRGGNISIVADNLVLSPDSLINAEALDAEEGIDGTVVTSEPAVDLASALVVLAAPPLDADALLREPCALRRDVGTSSFTGVGRGGLPAAPDRPLGSAYRPAAEAGTRSIEPAALTLALSCSNAD